MARNDDFVLGLDRVRNPTRDPYEAQANFSKSVLQNAVVQGNSFANDQSRWHQSTKEASAYKPRSVLDYPGFSGIGMAAEDRTRLLLNGERLRSPVGVSAATYQRRQELGMESPYRTYTGS